MKRQQRRTIAGLAAALLVASMPVPAIALAAGDNVDAGREVFETIAGIGCKSCHGDYAEGDLGVGPFIRGATEGSIRAAIEGIGEMVAVRMVIKEEEIAAVVGYIDYLGAFKVARTLSKRGRFLPELAEARPGTMLQVIIKNSGIKPASYQSDNMGIESFTVAGRSTDSIEWQAPEEEGDYSLYCTDCKLKDQFFVIKVHAGAPMAPGATATAAATPVSDGM